MTAIDFSSFSGASLAQGETLFFPSLDDRQQRPIGVDEADEIGLLDPRGITVRRLTLVGVDRVAVASGEIVALTLHVQVRLETYRELRRSLRVPRDLLSAPIRFDYEVDETGALTRLVADDRTLL
jgi:hypothetical protein